MKIVELENGARELILPTLEESESHDFYCLSGREFEYTIECAPKTGDLMVGMPKDVANMNVPSVCTGMVIPEDTWASVFCAKDIWVVWIWA